LLPNEKVYRPCFHPAPKKKNKTKTVFFYFSRFLDAFSCCSGAKFKHFAIQQILAAPSLIVDARYFCCKTATENKHLNENEKFV